MEVMSVLSSCRKELVARIVDNYRALRDVQPRHRLLFLVRIDEEYGEEDITRATGFVGVYKDEKDKGLDAGLAQLERYCADLKKAREEHRHKRGAQAKLKREKLEAA